jgi:predicted RNase H-like HicB family nuclease
MRAREEYKFTVLFAPAEEGGYVVRCPALPGLVTEEDTLEEARATAEDAIRGYLESLRKDGLSVPDDKKVTLDLVKEEPTCSAGPAVRPCGSSSGAVLAASPTT